MARAPAARRGRGGEMLAGASFAQNNLADLRAQHLVARFALPLATAALVAALAFGGSDR